MMKIPVTNNVNEMFAYTPTQYMIRAMMAGTAPHACYADQEEAPSVCMINEGHSLFVGGDSASLAADEAMEYLANTLLNDTRRKELGAIKIIFPNEAWKRKLSQALSGAQINEYPRCILSHSAAAVCNQEIPPHIQAISPAMKELDNFFMIQEEVESTLGSVEKFLAEGFGYALVLNKRVCGFCTAEYLSPGICAIGIAVEEQYRQKGYAAQMAHAFLKDSANRGLKPYWDCWKNNIGSYKTAERAGFEKAGDYTVLLTVFEPA